MSFFSRSRALHLKLGRTGENLAIKLLKSRNCTILSRTWRNNFTHDGAGELDIVALDGEVLNFIEVKTLRKLSRYRPGSHLSEAQKKRIRHGAKVYCRQHHIPETIDIRFDLIEVIYDGKKLRDIALHENYMPLNLTTK